MGSEILISLWDGRICVDSESSPHHPHDEEGIRMY
jgi:hypothetical protein